MRFNEMERTARKTWDYEQLEAVEEATRLEIASGWWYGDDDTLDLLHVINRIARKKIQAWETLLNVQPSYSRLLSIVEKGNDEAIEYCQRETMPAEHFPTSATKWESPCNLETLLQYHLGVLV